VEGVKKSNVIEVSFQHKLTRRWRPGRNLLVDDYKEKHSRSSATPIVLPRKQLAEYEQKLKESESRMEAFKQKNRSLPLKSRGACLKQRMELDTSLKPRRTRSTSCRENSLP
jgi:hypothetical protein